MAICPVCGCKTEELDFVERKLQDENFRVCSFCDRQLKVFDSDAEPTDAQIRWLDAVLSKEVAERDNNLIAILKKIRGRFPEKQVEQPVIVQQKNVVVQKANSGKSDDFEDENQIIKDLQKRITALEAEIRMMKRKQMIKTAIELGVPVVMFIALIIIIMSSGIIDNFKAILDMGGYTF